MKLSLQMSQTTASAHQHNPVALLAELVELLQSSIHDKAGCLRSAISGVVLVKRKKKYRRAEAPPPLASRSLGWATPILRERQCILCAID